VGSDRRRGASWRRSRLARPRRWGQRSTYGGEQPQDAQVGGWSREERERMDEKFRAAFERALRQEGSDER
jgi:hypothetical protein